MTQKSSKIVYAIVGFSVAGLLFFPIFWMFLTSFKTELLAAATPPRIFFNPTLESFMTALSRTDYRLHFLNSMIASFGSTALALLMGILPAYGIAFYSSKAMNFSLLWMLSTRMIPPVGVVIPIYLIFRQLRLLDNIFGLAIVLALMNLPILVWLLYSYFKDIPVEVLEAAKVDGASTFQETTRVLIPLSMPGITSASLIGILLAWNEFFWSYMLTGAAAAPLSVFITSFKAAEGLFWAQMSAASTLAVIPVLVMGWIAQKQLIRGLTLGAVK